MPVNTPMKGAVDVTAAINFTIHIRSKRGPLDMIEKRMVESEIKRLTKSFWIDLIICKRLSFDYDNPRSFWVEGSTTNCHIPGVVLTLSYRSSKKPALSSVYELSPPKKVPKSEQPIKGE